MGVIPHSGNIIVNDGGSSSYTPQYVLDQATKGYVDVAHTGSSGSFHDGTGGTFKINGAEPLIYGMKYSGDMNTPAQIAYGQGSGNNSAATVASGHSSDGLTSAASTQDTGWNDYLALLREITDTNNQFNLDQTKAVNEFNAQQAALNRDWQERMSNTAHQREVADLIKAGLNPVLSAGGQGAVTGSGAVASGQKAVADNTLGNGAVGMIERTISAISAERVAQIQAAASMHNANVMAGASRYGSNLSYAAQMSYQQVMKDTNMANNLFGVLRSLIGMQNTSFWK